MIYGTFRIERPSEKITNERRNRKYCDISAATAALVNRLGAPEAYGLGLVDYVVSCASGDSRKVIDTLSDLEMETIVARLQEPYRRLCAKGYNDESFLADMLPASYSNGRAPYRPVDDVEIARAPRAFLLERGGDACLAAAQRLADS